MGIELVLAEMEKANKILIETQLGMKKGDEMLIPTTEEFLGVAKSAQAYADGIGVRAYVVLVPPIERGTYPKALQSMANEVDGIYSLGMGFSTKEALDHGTRLLGVILDDETLVRTLVRVNLPKLKEEAWKIRDAISDCETLRITSHNGTDFTEDRHGKIGSPGGMWAGDPWEELYEFSPLGYPGYARYPPLGTCNGKLVYDLYLTPFGLIREPVVCTIVKDEIVKVEGGWEAKRFWNNIKDWPEKFLAEMQIGINPNARMPGKGPEWERYRGGVHFGMGSIMPYPAFGENGKLLNPDWKPAKFHCDGMMAAPTVYADDKLIVKDGILQHPYD